MDWIAKCAIGLAIGLAIAGSLQPDTKFFALRSAESGQQAPAQESDSSKPASPLSYKPPERDASGNYKPGNGVSTPQVIDRIDPEFPEAASRKKLGGTSVVSFVVDENGLPHDVHVVRSSATGLKKKEQRIGQAMDENAVKAVQQYRFKPGTYQGKPVAVALSIEVTYRIY